MKILVSSRKGLFIWARNESGAWQIQERCFLGEPVSFTLVDPLSGDTYAALNLGHFGVKLRRRDAGSTAWTEVGVPKFPAVAEGEKEYSLKMIWSMSSGPGPNGNLLYAGTIPGALFTSADRGESWQIVQSLWDQPSRPEWFGGGYDEAGVHSILVDPRDPKRVLIGISCAGVWETCDGGETWANHGEGLRNAYMPPDRASDPVAQDPHQMVRCASAPDTIWMQHHNGIFVSETAGVTWREITDVNPSVFGFAVAVHPNEPGTAWFVPGQKDEYRIPVDGKLVVTRTRDFGANFQSLCDGLPQGDAYDLVYRHALSICAEGKHLAFGSTTGNLWFSDNQGSSWKTLSKHMPPIYAVTIC